MIFNEQDKKKNYCKYTKITRSPLLLCACIQLVFLSKERTCLYNVFSHVKN